MKHEDSHIYQRALELIDVTKAATDKLPVGFAFLADQMRRAASSVALNFAEGCGKAGERDRRRYFHTARGSAYEVAAVLDVGHRFGAVDAALRLRGKDICDHLAAMLSRYR